MLDPQKRWRPLPDKPDYAGFLTFGGLPLTQEPAELAGVDVAIVGAPTDDLVSDRPRHALRAAGDSQRIVSARARTSKRASTRSLLCTSSTTATHRCCLPIRLPRTQRSNGSWARSSTPAPCRDARR